MAAGNVTVYSNAALALTKAAMNLASDTFVCILVTASYTPAPNTDATYANVSANEVATGGGYTQGGVVLTSVTDTLSGATVTYNAAAASWSSATITAQYAVIVHRAGASLASTDLLLSYVNLNSGGGSVSSTNGTFSVTWNASGIFTLTHTP
ncbi:hypothetical protein [Rhodopila sp.]|uniref:hypothetical protein n=1 Tax=Rhodopila sp. TaxID=2480087 RepID=UPI003D0BB766